MFIKFRFFPNCYTIFRTEDVLSINPLFGKNNKFCGKYLLRLVNCRDVIQLTSLEADRLISLLDYKSIDSCESVFPTPQEPDSQSTPNISQSTPNISPSTPNISPSTPNISQSTPNISQPTPIEPNV